MPGTMWRGGRLLAASAACGLGAGWSGGGVGGACRADPIFRTVALTGTQAPGLPAGVNFAYLSDPRVTAAGVVSLWAELAGAGVTTANDGSVWSERSGMLAVVQREGDASGVGTLVYAAMPSPAVNAGGQVALIGSLIDPAVQSNPINLAIFGEAAAPVRLLVAHEGDPQPPPGAVNWAKVM